MSVSDSLNDPARLAALRDTGLLDSEAEVDFDRLAKLASKLLGAPISLVSLVDGHRQFFKSAVGLGEPWASARQTPLTHSFCKHTVRNREALVVGDARTDPRVRDNLAVHEMGVVAYAGVPIKADNQIIGAFCVIDPKPRQWTSDQLSILRELASTVENLIELRRANRRLAELHLRMDEQAAIMRQALSQLPNTGTMIFDRDLRFVMAEGAVLKRFGIDPLSVPGRTAAEVHSVQNLQRVEAMYREALDGHEGMGELERDGSVLEVHTLPLRGPDGTVVRGMLVFTDVTEQKREMSTLRAVASTLPNSAVAIFNHSLRYTFAEGPLLERITGYRADDIVGRELAAVLTPPGEARRDVTEYARALDGVPTHRELVRDGRVYELRIAPVHDHAGRIVAGASMLYDITDRKRETEALVETHALLLEKSAALERASITDELTGLHNRRGFMLLSEQALRLARRNERPLVVFFLDLNGMKQINDRLGHDVGDRALVATADVLRAVFRESDVLSRLGGDEFAVLVAESDAKSIPFLAERVEANVAALNAAKKERFVLSVSFGGVVREATSDVTLQTLLTQADALMYERKRERKEQRTS